MMPERFADKVAIVTGGGNGIGAAVCKRLSSEGARVVVADIDKAAAERTAEGLTHGLAVQVCRIKHQATPTSNRCQAATK